jgi:hypothetical protein
MDKARILAAAKSELLRHKWGNETPDKSDYRTSRFLVLHFSGERESWALARTEQNKLPLHAE